MSTQDTTTADTVPDFLPFISGVDRGNLVLDAGTKLQELVAAIRDTGKGGSLTIRLDIKPTSRTPGLTGTVQVTHAVTTKVPALPKRESVFFIADDGGLSRTPTDPALFD